MFIKRLTVGLVGLAAIGLLISCEKMSVTDPYLSTHLYNHLQLIDTLQAPVGPAIPLNKVQKLIINDFGFAAMIKVDSSGILVDSAVGLPMTELTKITFQ